jgi:hypothetical protein
MYNSEKDFCGIATALHVVNYSEDWKQPIRLIHHSSQQSLFLQESDRVIFTDWKTDSAVILLQKKTLPLPDDAIELFPASSVLPVGQDVAWLGFPAIEPFTLCFFSGNVSAYQAGRNAYIVDGVAINGVSGGPVISATGVGSLPQVIGIVSGYKANRTGGDTLPGLLYAQDVSHFHSIIDRIRSIDEAYEQQQALAKQQGQQQQPIPSPAPIEPQRAPRK